MTLIIAAEPSKARTDANEPTSGTLPGFPHEIGARADGPADLIGSPSGVSSLALAGAVCSPSKPDGAGSFPGKTCEFCKEPMERHPNEATKAWKLRRFCNYVCSNRASVGRRNHSHPAGYSLGGGSFPAPIDAAREAELYGDASYTDSLRAQQPEPRFNPSTVEWLSGIRTL